MAYIMLRFHATWCAPCRAMERTIEKVIPDFKNLRIVSIDVDEDSDLSVEYKIRSVPTLILIQDDKEVKRLVGNRNEDELRKFLS